MTATFAPQDNTVFTAIRYYTQFDPYFYTVDNRPLQDIETNLRNISLGGGDAARRAIMLNSMAMSADFQASYPSVTGSVKYSTGLNVSVPVTNSITVAPGAVYESRAINDTNSNTIIKQALSVLPQTFVLTPPVGVGTSIVYTIEGQFTEFTNANMATSTTPYVDSTNTFLPSTMLQGELRMHFVSGAPATTGTETASATTSGWYPLFNITYIYGVANPVVWAHPNAPVSGGIMPAPAIIIPHTTNGATQSILQDCNVYSFVDAATNTVVIPVSLLNANVNPYKPIKLKLSFSPSITGGAYAMQIRYKALAAGDLITTTKNTSGLEVINITSPADSVQSALHVTAVIPNTEFSGFVNGAWTVTKERLTLNLDRLGAHASDTSTSVLRLFEVVVLQ